MTVGPRQVGKTKLITLLLGEITTPYISESADGVGSSNLAWLSQLWETARLTLKSSVNSELLLVVDEIQKIDNWSEVIKQQWDRDTRDQIKIKVILLGSSRLLIQKGLTESLAGRFETTHIGHWSFKEMHDAFGWDIQQYVYFGGYPGAASLISDEKRWRNYINDSLIETSISKDILMLTRVDKPALLKRLFELGSHYSGQILSLTKVVGQLQDAGNTTTRTHYLSLLSDCGLLGGINKYAGEQLRKKASIPKFQIYNNALLTAQSTTKFEETFLDPKEWGRLVESSVGAHLINYAVSEGYNLYYWREGNDEVDYIIEYGDKTIGIEVKIGRRGENRRLSVFAAKFNPTKVMLVGTGGIPYEEFLKMNPIDLL